MVRGIVFDFEAFGGAPGKNAFTQLGAVVFNFESGMVEGTFNMYARQDGYEQEQRCVKEFWSRPEMKERFETTLAEAQKAEKNPYQVITAFREWCLSWEQLFPGCVLVTDNSNFDLGLLKFFSETDTMYFLGRLTECVDTGVFYKGAMRLPLGTSIAKSKFETCVAQLQKQIEGPVDPFDPGLVAHDHNPVNDAHMIALKLHYVNNLLKKLPS